MAKLVNAHDSGSCEEILEGSSPPIDSILILLGKYAQPTDCMPES